MIHIARRRLVACATLAAAGLAMFLWWREGNIVREGELFDIRASGRVYNYANGQPIPDAWVLLGLHSSNPTIGGYGGGCSDGSAVVKTDANGEFSYRATIRKAGSGSMGFWTFVYHPDYAGQLRWQPPKIPGVSTFPINHKPDGVPLSIGMTRRNIDEWVALDEIDEYAQQACLVWTFNRGHAVFSRLRYERTLALHCGSDRDGPFPLKAVMSYLEGRLYEQAKFARPDETSSARSDDQIFRRSYVATQLLHEYPWDLAQKDYRYPPRDLTAAEKAAFCSFYLLPAENLINKEFLP